MFRILVINENTDERNTVCTVNALGDAIIIKDALQLNCTITNIKYVIEER